MTTTPAKEQQAPSPQGGGRRIRGFALASVLAALLLTLLLEALDQTIVGTALPRIVGQLQGFDRYTWVVTAYLLGSTTMIPIVGKLSDQFGRKWFFVFGVILFLIGSALSGAAQTMDQLIAFRAIQGIGAGTGIALVFTVVGDIFPPAERARWQGIFASVYGFSSVVGPTVGGWLTDNGPVVGNLITNETRWRWVFYVNIPIGILALIVLLIYLPTNISTRSNQLKGWAALRRIDFIGAILASGATICLLLGLTWGGNQTYDWASPQVTGTLVASGILYIAFLVTERFVAEPILPLDLFRNRVFAADMLLGLTAGMTLLGLVIYLPLFLQGVMGESATNSGVVITPMTVSITVGSAAAGIIIAKMQRYQLITILGAIITTVGIFLMTLMTPNTSLLETWRNMIISGVGIGIFFSVMTLAVQNALPRTRMGVGTGAIRYIGALGQTLGVAIVGSVVNSTIASDILTRIPASTIQQLTPAGLKFATDPQVLTNPVYKNTVIKTAEGYASQVAAAKATANIPPGPQHNAVAHQAAAQAILQVQHTLNQVFDALRLSLAVAIQHGFVAVLIFSVGILVASVLLKDVPLSKQFRDEPGTQKPAEQNTADTSAPAAML
ncbi:MAG: MDR family MFS transporter [Ktedonobacteraceae bacterium]